MPIRLVTTQEKGVKDYRWAMVKTAWGYAAFVCRNLVLCRFFLPRQNRESIFEAIQSEFVSGQRDDELLAKLQQALRKYFSGGKVEFDCAVDITWAGEFAQMVLRECCKIKPGQVVTYKQLACRVGRGAARSVGAVMKSNRVPLIIPCHRVVSANGGLGGYSAPGGLVVKKRLLAFEKSTIFAKSKNLVSKG